MSAAAPRLLMVCLGNICRSPTAEAALRAEATAHGLALEVDSAGTGSWHVGNPPDARMRVAAARAGLAMDHLRARQVGPRDFTRFDAIYAMDASNRADLEALRPSGNATPVHLFRADGLDVPDPYYTSTFDEVVTLIRGEAARIVADIASR
ncbi:MAG: low molecular weight protein-tyrosine-phosphatase [Pseudomonadota bacterium]